VNSDSTGWRYRSTNQPEQFTAYRSIGSPSPCHQGISMDILAAPSLGCHMLRAETRRDGVILQSRTFEDLRHGDPDPQLFEIPANYKLTEAAISR
jgi:hypothetical protein